jgi:protocatechuate 3,4-dioxygenase beta subunit
MPRCSYSTNSLFRIAALCIFQVPAFVWCQTTAASQPSAAGEYRIAGTVVSKSDGHPLERVAVAVIDVKNRKNVRVMITSEDGRFLFQGLTAGKYSLEGRRKGYIDAAYDSHEQYSTAIVTGADFDTEHLILRLPPAGVIAGKVLDESGEPVRHAAVAVYYDDHSSGIAQVGQIRRAQTDDQGDYEVTPLVPGTYFVSASATPWYAVHPNSQLEPDSQLEQPGASPVSVDRSLDVTYPLTYYGDETEPENASPIPIRGDDHVTADIHLSPAPALTLRFHVPENAQNGFQLPQLQQTGFDGRTTYVQGTGFRTVSPGVMEITGIPVGKYNVRLNGEGSGAQMSNLDLNKEGQELDLSSAEALSSVKITVNLSGDMPHRSVVALRSGRRQVVAWQQVDAKGEAELQQVPAGVYDVLAWNFGKPYSIDRMTVDGAQVQDQKVKVAGGSSPSISLTLIEGSVQVQGVVKRAGKRAAGAMVVLVPKDPELNRDRFRRDQSDLDGTFSLPGVVPGSYTVLAIDNGWELDWSQPVVIAAYLKHGRSVEIANQSGRTVDLGEPIEVQSK